MAALSQTLPPLHPKADTTLTQQNKGECQHTHTHTRIDLKVVMVIWADTVVSCLLVSSSVSVMLKETSCILNLHLSLSLSSSSTFVLQCCSGELFLTASPSAAPSTLPSSLHAVLPAGGAGGGPVLGAHPPTQQTARPGAAQLPGSAGVSLYRHTHREVICSGYW